MLTHVKIESYQSLKNVDINLGQLTVVVGPSNSGKSALVRALQAWAQNESGNDFVTMGQKSSLVEVTLDSGERVAWMKGATGRYVINDGGVDERTFTKIGTNVPEEIQDLTRVRRIEVDGLKLSPQFAGQFDPPFLLSESSGRAAKILAKVTNLDRLVTAAVAANRDLKRARQRGENLTEQMEDKRAQEEAVGDVEEEEKQYEQLLETYETLLRKDAHLDDLNTAADEYDALIVSLSKPRVSVKKVQASIDAVASIQELYRLAGECSVIRQKLSSPVVPLKKLDSAIEHVQKAAELHRNQKLFARTTDALLTNSTALTALESTVRMLEAELSEFDICPTCGRVN